MVGKPGQGDHNERTTQSNTQVLFDLGLSRGRERNARSCRISKWPLCIFRNFDLPDLIHKGSCPCLKACPYRSIQESNPDLRPRTKMHIPHLRAFPPEITRTHDKPSIQKETDVQHQNTQPGSPSLFPRNRTNETTEE